METLSESILGAEPVLRLSVFFGVLAVMAAAEALLPRRLRGQPRALRWPNNIAVVVVDTAIVRLLFPLLPAGVALIAAERGWGLLNMFPLGDAVAFVVAVVVLDLAIYAQHVAFHKVPVLWRLHRMHHADTDIDVTTGARFHPIEIVLSIVIKMAVVVALGAPAAAVIVFEILLNATSMFNHANLDLPRPIDRFLRMVLVTPDMHRVHHSVHRDETDSNYGFNLTWWDRLFGTYRDQPRDGHGLMQIGLPEFRDDSEQRLDRLLTQPFRDS